MEHLNHLAGELLRSQVVITLLSGTIIGFLTYVTAKLKSMTAQAETDQQVLTEQAESAKRSALRTEYLGIYNSQMFTLEQKYGMTRDIMREYELLNGNHYLHALDQALKEKLDKELGEERQDDEQQEV